MIRGWIRKWLLNLLGVTELQAAQQRFNDRLVAVEQHFVTQRDPATGQPTETLADRHADEDGRPRPKPLAMKRSRSWDQQRRYLEAQSAIKQ